MSIHNDKCKWRRYFEASATTQDGDGYYTSLGREDRVDSFTFRVSTFAPDVVIRVEEVNECETHKP